MRKNPGRKDARLEARKMTHERGDLNRKSTHKMRTHDGMVSSGHFAKTSQGMVKV